MTNAEGSTDTRAQFSFRTTPDGLSISAILDRAAAATIPFEFQIAANGALSVLDRLGDPIRRNDGSCGDRSCVSHFETAANGFTRKRIMQWSRLENGASFSYRVDATEPAYGGRPARQFWFSHDCQLTRVQ